MKNSREGKGNGIPFITPSHEFSGRSNNFIHIRRTGITYFCAPHNYTLTRLSVNAHSVHICLYNMQEHIRVRLLMRPLVLGIPAPLYVCLRTIADQIVFLAILQVTVESFMIFGSCGLVTVIGHHRNRI